MNRKQFFIVLVALALVGSAGLILIHRNQQSWRFSEVKAGDKVFPTLHINDIATIHVKGEGEDFNIIHTNDLWCIRERDDYPADFALIRDFLLKIRDLRVVQSDQIGPSEFARLDLNAPGDETNSATLLEFKDSHDKILAALFAGKKHPRPQNDSEPLGLHGLFDGRYVLLPNDSHNVLLVSDALAALIPNPGLWLSQDFFKVENIKFISLVSTNAADSWEISRADSSSPWVLANPRSGEVLNAKTAFDIDTILAFPTFNDVSPKTPESLMTAGLDKPIVVTILTDYFAYTLKVGPLEPDGDRPLTVNVEANIPATDPDALELQQKFMKERALSPWIFEAGSWIERVIRDRSYLVEQKSADNGQTASNNSAF